MNVAVESRSDIDQRSQPALAWRFALRELRGGLAGFYVFLACIALGVAAISGVNSVARSITDGIAAQGQAILAGDVSFSMVQQELPSEAHAFIEQNGTVSRASSMRGMARLIGGSGQTLVEMKAVDGRYPLYGELKTEAGGFDIAGLGVDEILAEPLLGERLGVQPGDKLAIGNQVFTIVGFIASEPDRLSDGFGFGPRVMMTRAALNATQLVQPGSLITHVWKVRLDDNSPAGVRRIIAGMKTRFPDAGWRTRSRDNAAPALSRNISRFSDFLTLIGLTALVVGGVGVANAVRAFLDTKRPVIATFKSLGAPGEVVFMTYLMQILILSGIGIAVGLLIGASMPPVAAWAMGDLLPVPQTLTIYPMPLALGAVYGLLTALAFAVWPLGTAREVPATDLFRGQTEALPARLPRLSSLVMLAAAVLALVGLALLMSENRFIAATFIGAMAFSFLLLRGVSWAIQRLAAMAPRLRSTEMRMAIANIHRPGSLTPSVVLSLGLGLALLVALAMIDGNLRRQVSGNLPERAPDFFFVDIQNADAERFEALLGKIAPDGKIFSVPMLRGRIVSLKGVRAEDYKASEGAWVLRGDRGITYAGKMPENSSLAKGAWWPADYTGPPLVSFSGEEAGELGLDVGDEIVVNVLGRNITATIASLRNVEWESLAINFVMVFSPNTFAGAPHSVLATLMIDGDSGGASQGASQGASRGASRSASDDNVDGRRDGSRDRRDGEVVAAVARDFPAVTTVRVREALDTVNRLIGQLATAIRAAASVALIASVLVLGGALAAGNRARVHDAVVLKTLGATRGSLMRAFIYEYALLGLATAVFALVAGGLAAWFVIKQIMQFPYAFLPSVAGATVAVALAMTVGFGLIGTWRILGQKAAPVLREL